MQLLQSFCQLLFIHCICTQAVQNTIIHSLDAVEIQLHAGVVVVGDTATPSPSQWWWW